MDICGDDNNLKNDFDQVAERRATYMSNSDSSKITFSVREPMK